MADGDAPTSLLPLWCPRCRVELQDDRAALRCDECGRRYSRQPAFVDFLADGADDHTAQSWLWDREADQDEVAAAAATPKQDAADVFVKMPPLLPQLPIDGSVLLDLGCGYGRTLLAAAGDNEPAAAIGVDVSAVMLTKARRYALELGLEPMLVRASVDALPLPDASVDVVYSSAVMLHLPKPVVIKALREAHRVLRPGGMATFESSFLGWANPDGLQQRVVTTVARRALRPAYVRTYGYRELVRLVAGAGPWRRAAIEPERHKIVPTVAGTHPIPALKPAFKRLNAAASARLRTRAAFVASWSVQLER